MQTNLVKTALLLSVGAGLLSSCGSETSPVDRYEYKHDGSVVYDKETNLEWMRCALGETWNNAASICEGASVTVEFAYVEGILPAINVAQSGINVSGDSDWRAPSIQELRSLRYCSEVSEAEQMYISEEENKQLKVALRKFADLQLKAVSKSEEEISDLESEQKELQASLTSDIEDLKASIAALNADLESDIANLKSETQQEQDESASIVSALELAFINFENSHKEVIAKLESDLVNNDIEKEKERARHESTISSVKSEFSDKLKKVRKLKEDLESAKSKRTSSKVVKLKEEIAYLTGVVEFFEKVYTQDRTEIDVINREVKSLSEASAELADYEAQDAKVIEDLEREIANTINPEIEDLFDSEDKLSSLKRRYYREERSIEADMDILNSRYTVEHEKLKAELDLAKLSRMDRLKATAETNIATIETELVIVESTLAGVAMDTARRVKIEEHNIRKINVVLDTFLDILEIDSMDQLDTFLAQDVLTDMPNIDRLKSDGILNKFSVYTNKVAELQGTFPGVNDRTREPCGYLERSPIRSYSNSDLKDGLINGVWMLDDVAFPPTLKLSNNKPTNGTFYWSGTELGYNELRAWGVNFKDGLSSSKEKAFPGRIRLVRDAK